MKIATVAISFSWVRGTFGPGLNRSVSSVLIVPSATAILDRFLQHATIINITGKSYRLRNRSKADREGRRSTADGERLSPPEDTAPVTALSSDGKQQHATA